MIPRSPGFFPRIPNLVANTPSIQVKANVEMFFDRAAVQAALDEMDLKALSKASMLVKDRAKRIIKKKGLARLSTKVRTDFPGAGVTALVQMGVIGQRAGNTIIREVQRPKGSPAGSPPFTHTPYAGHFASYIGFRRNLWNFYDASTHSAVVGPSKKGRPIPYLHEFGGHAQMMTWAFVPQIRTKRGGMRQPIVMKLPVGARPRNASRWQPMSIVNGAHYPARPFMQPAMRFCIANNSIAKAFRAQFKNMPGARGTGHFLRIM